MPAARKTSARAVPPSAPRARDRAPTRSVAGLQNELGVVRNELHRVDTENAELRSLNRRASTFLYALAFVLVMYGCCALLVASRKPERWNRRLG